MKIVKFCMKAHNPLLTETNLQLGALSYYKSTDNRFIRDADEGVLKRIYHPSQPIRYSGEQIGKILGSSISGSGMVRFEGRAVGTTYPIPNAYLFCTSKLSNPTFAQAQELGYDSFYAIREPNLFCDRIRSALQKQLGYSFQLFAFHGRVSYQVDKEVILTQLHDFVQSHRVIEPYFYLLKRQTSPDTNGKVFANEEEYRFAFIPMDAQHRTVPLPSDRIYIESSTVRDLIDECETRSGGDGWAGQQMGYGPGRGPGRQNPIHSCRWREAHCLRWSTRRSPRPVPSSPPPLRVVGSKGTKLCLRAFFCCRSRLVQPQL
jgi:hypothetical protein